MAALPSNNTKRFFLDYDTCGFGHTLLCRTTPTVTAADAGATINAFLLAIEAEFRLITVTGFRSAAEGSNLTFPETWPGDASFGAGAGSAFESAHYMDYVGRGQTGHRCRVAVFGMINASAGDDYRLTVAENVLVSNAIDELTSDANIFNDVDGQSVVWNPYANVGTNAYWRNKIR